MPLHLRQPQPTITADDDNRHHPTGRLLGVISAFKNGSTYFAREFLLFGRIEERLFTALPLVARLTHKRSACSTSCNGVRAPATPLRHQRIVAGW